MLLVIGRLSHYSSTTTPSPAPSEMRSPYVALDGLDGLYVDQAGLKACLCHHSAGWSWATMSVLLSTFLIIPGN